MDWPAAPNTFNMGLDLKHAKKKKKEKGKIEEKSHLHFAQILHVMLV